MIWLTVLSQLLKLVSAAMSAAKEREQRGEGRRAALLEVLREQTDLIRSGTSARQIVRDRVLRDPDFLRDDDGHRRD